MIERIKDYFSKRYGTEEKVLDMPAESISSGTSHHEVGHHNHGHVYDKEYWAKQRQNHDATHNAVQGGKTEYSKSEGKMSQDYDNHEDLRNRKNNLY